MAVEPGLHVELVNHLYTNRGKTVLLDEVRGKVYSHPAWRSYFSYPVAVADIPAYRGPIALDEIVMDLDAKEHDLAAVQEEAQQLTQYLIHYLDVPADLIRVAFSGGRGFHVHIPDVFGFKAASNLPIRLRSTLREEFDFLKTLDLSMINKSGLIRLTNSRHNKTGLYKVQLPPGALFSFTTDEILEYAKTPQPESLLDLDIDPILPQLRRNAVPVVEKRFDPSRKVVCMQKLLKKGPHVGTNHNEIMRLSAWMYHSGIPQEQTLMMLTQWLGRSTDDLVRSVAYVYEKEIKYGCSDDIMSEHCDSSCIFYQNRSYGSKNMVRSPSDMLKGLAAYKKKLDEKKGINLKLVHPSMKWDYWILPGEVVMITGDTGMGKSAYAQNLVVKAGKKTLYLNLEMSEALTTRRFIQIGHGGLTKYEAMDLLGRTTPERIMAPIQHISMISIAPKLEEVKRAVLDEQPDVVVVDTTDVIEVPEAGNNEMWQLKAIIEGMRKLAQQRQIIVICVHHINKTAAREHVIDLNALTGNRSNVTKVDHVFSLVGDRDSEMRRLRSLKARDEEPITLPLLFKARQMLMVPDTSGDAPLFEGVE